MARRLTHHLTKQVVSLIFLFLLPSFSISGIVWCYGDTTSLCCGNHLSGLGAVDEGRLETWKLNRRAQKILIV